MKRLLTGALIAAVLVSQTSIADVFVHTDAATVKAAENQEGADDIVVGFTDDSATPGNTDPEEVVQQEDIVGNPVVNPNEEQTPEEDTELKKDETPADSDVTPEVDGTPAEISGAAADVQDGTKTNVPYDAVQNYNNEIMTASVEAVACDGSCVCSNCDPDCECDADCSCTETGECGDDCNCSCNTPNQSGPDGEYFMGDGQEIKVTYEDGKLTIEPNNWSSGNPDVAIPDYADGTEDTVGNNLTTIPWWEFRENITSIEIEDHIASIGSYVFKNCMNVTSVTIPNSVKSINEGAFEDCENLTSINFESGNMTLETIGDKAFKGCTGLTSIALPRGVKNIANGAFEGCSSLGVIIYPQGADISNVKELDKVAKIEYKFDDNGKIQITKIESSDKVSLPSEIFGEKIASVADDVNTDLIGEHKHIGNGNDCSAKCDICGEDLHPEKHKYEPTEPVKAANCTDAAIWLYTCSTCGDTKEDFNADEGPLNHSYTAWDSNESNHWHVCSRCQEKDPNGSEDPHVKTVTETGGFKVTKCSVCKKELSKEAIGGNNNNNNYQSTDSNNGGSSSGSGSSSSGSSSSSTSATTGSVWNTVSTAAEIPGTITTAITYTVQSGDTLSKIAVKYYGSASYWTKIYEDNKDTIKDPNKIYVGQVIIINVVQVDTASAVAGTTVTGEGSQYTVESGDSLYKIAKKVYGDGKDWRLIYNANDAITDPGRIYSGQVIFIPVKQ